MGRRGRSAVSPLSRSARSGWSKTAGGPRNPCKDDISSWCWRMARTSSSSPNRMAAGSASGIDAAPGREAEEAALMEYTELHCHSAYSFLDGASDPAELAATAASLGHEALALTDHDNVCGAMEFAH